MRTNPRRPFSVFTTMAVALLLGFALQTSHCSAQETPDPSIDDFAWIAGHWTGNALGGAFEETWNPPLGGTMMGMFKLTQKGEVAFHEILTIMKVDGKFVLRLKHFDASLVGWEAKDAWEQFPLVSVSETKAVFDGLRFEKQGKDGLRIIVLAGEEKENPQELIFECKRADMRASDGR